MSPPDFEGMDLDNIVQRSLGRIEGKLDAIKEHFEETDRDIDNIYRRLRKVEGRQHWYSGAAAVFGSALGFFFHGRIS